MRETDTKTSEEGGGGGVAPGTRAEMPLMPLEKIMVKEIVLSSPWRTSVEQISTLQTMEDPMPQQADVP
ncbi:hypothetical protein llap_1700 [Limosa lapponica baueri]|uniref:Uncharacterized protein n=1 Tax=Limosa lapponica baueri TaxID=1758121 RepID=A0A2I0UPN0_LIMLA|nr:hypothetical protein llap_1700 [Limosa lapponica baueri]